MTPESTPFQPPGKCTQPLTPDPSVPAEQKFSGAPESLIYHSREDPNDNAPCPSPAVNQGPPLLLPCPPGTPPAPHPCPLRDKVQQLGNEQAGEVAHWIKEALLQLPPPLPPFRGRIQMDISPLRTAERGSMPQRCRAASVDMLCG